MAIVIHDFEVVQEPPAPPATPNPETPVAESEEEKEPDLERVLRLWHERRERLRAH